MKLYRRILAAAVMLGLCAALAACSTVLDVTVSVMVEAGEGYRVLSENPVTVRAGEDAVFTVEVEDGYTYVSGSGAVLNGNTLVVSRVLYPETVSLKMLRSNGKSCEFSLYDMSLSGTLFTSAEPGEYPAGTEVTVSAVPYEGFKFNGWSTGATLARGGKLYSRDAETTVTLTSDVALYANFSSNVGIVSVFYDANGGVYAQTGETVYEQECSISYYSCPNCLAAMDYFVREGYQLLEYNTKPDGTGDAYSLGSKLILPKEGEMRLYCIWVRESDASLFKTKTAGGSVTITGYTGNEEMVVVPEKIGGKPVTAIAAGTFKGKSFTTLVLPKSLKTVSAGAIADCASLTTLYMHDNIESIPDDAITGKTNFKNFRLNAAEAPKFTNSTEGCFCIKWERIVTSEKPCLVVLSGSSSLNGLNSPMLDEFLEGKYTIVNYGTNAGTCGVLYMEFLSHFLGEGDILIDAPEMGGEQAGQTNITWRIFRGTEAYNNIWRYVDISRYSHLFSELTAFNKERANMNDLTYEHHDNNMNEYGDLVSGARDKLNATNYRAGSTFPLSPETFGGSNATNLNWAYEQLQNAGVTVYFSCAPYNANSLTVAARTEAAAAAYNAGMRKYIKVPVISEVQNYAIPGEYMFNSDYHPNFFGSDMRTEQLIKDLSAQMKKDGLLS